METAAIKGNGIPVRKIEWLDSSGIQSGWQELKDFRAEITKIESVGFIIYENAEVIALAHNYANETHSTPEQANGIMIIPKCCIISSSVLFYQAPA
jgi:hypothetical protein